MGQTLLLHWEHALSSIFLPVWPRERNYFSQSYGLKESMTPIQRGTGKQAENVREFQEEEFEKQICDYKGRRVRVN